MADQPTFERALEADIERLAAEIKNERERPGAESAGEKELVKEAIRSFGAHERTSSGSAAAPAPSGRETASKGLMPEYAEKAPAEVKLEIEYLMDLALKSGLGAALAEARKAPYFVQDALHDALAGRLYPELKKRGIVK